MKDDTVVVGDASFEAMAAKMLALHKEISEEDEVPPDWFSSDTYAATTKMGRGRARKILESVETKGLLESKLYRIRTKSGMRHIRHYHFI